jgi:hypothetical protein
VLRPQRGEGLGRIEHRQTRRGSAPRHDLGTLPVVGRVFLALAALTAAIELWPIVNAIWIGATTWPGEIPDLLPQAARAAGMVALPAAVAWASPRRYRTNGWLWNGALLVAVIQLLRYPVDVARDAAINSLMEGGADLGDPVPLVLNLGVGLGLAFLSVLGVWALGEGLKDAGGRSTVAVVVAAVVSLALGLLLLVPAFMAGATLELGFVPDLLSVAVNSLYVFANALLAGRAIAGVLRGLRPVAAWRAGAVGGSVAFLIPVLSLAVLLVSSYLLPADAPFSVPYLGVATYFGWPLVAIAIGMGMGRLERRAPGLVGSGFVMRGRPRLAPSPAS